MQNSPLLSHQANIYLIADTRVATLPEAVQCRPQHSFCPLLALAAHLNYTINVPLPLIEGSILKRKFERSRYSGEPNYRGNYIEVWCDLLFSILSEGHVTEDVGTIYFGIAVPENYIDEFKVDRASLIIKDHCYKTKEQAVDSLDLLVGKAKQQRVKTRKIAFIQFSTSILNTDIIKPRLHAEGLIGGIFYNNGEIWKSYRVLSGQVPTAQELMSYDTVIMGGSSHSVTHMPPLIRTFKFTLKQALKLNSKLKVIGFCFGHQLLAQMNEGNIQSRKLARGLDDLRFKPQVDTQNSQQLPTYLSDSLIDMIKSVRLFKNHSDAVTQVPLGFWRFGTSSNLEIEGLISHDYRIMSFQSHPEYTLEYIRNFEQRLADYTGDIDKFTIFHENGENEKHHEGVKAMRKFIRQFIDWQT